MKHKDLQTGDLVKWHDGQDEVYPNNVLGVILATDVKMKYVCISWLGERYRKTITVDKSFVDEWLENIIVVAR